MNYTFSISIDVRFRDLDAMGHVNNAVYSTYLEIARTAYMQKLMGFLTMEEINFVLARVEIDFRRGAVFGQVLLVDVGIVRLGRSSFTLGYRITTDEGRILIAEAVSVLAWYDYKKGTVLPFPPDVRARMEAETGAVAE